MVHMRKILLTTAAMLVLGSTAGCNIAKMESYFAPDRRLPEGSSTTFDNIHSPVLNPTGNDPGRHTPSQEINGSMNDGTFQKAPVTPVASTNMDGYPSLASVPQKPDVPPSAELKGNMNSLVADQKAADTSRTNLMNDPNVTVMTSPQTGQLVANAADATPPAAAPVATTTQPATPSTPETAAQPATQTANAGNASNDTGFGSWLHNHFSADKKSAPADATTTANAAPAIATAEQTTARRAPAENPVSDAATSAVVDGTVTQSSGTASNITTANGAPVLRAPLQVVAQAPQEEPVGLEAPPSALTQPAPQSSVPAAVAPAAANTGAPAPAANATPASVTAQATAKTVNSDGFNSWMDEIFGKQQDKAANNAAPAEPATASAEPAPTPVAAAAAPAPAPVQQSITADVSATATSVPVTDAALANASAQPPAAAAAAPAPVASAQPALPSTNTLQQPPKDLSPNAINSQSLPDLSQLENKNAAPVNLVQPSDADYATSYSSDGYLADSRYASRQHSSDN